MPTSSQCWSTFYRKQSSGPEKKRPGPSLTPPLEEHQNRSGQTTVNKLQYTTVSPQLWFIITVSESTRYVFKSFPNGDRLKKLRDKRDTIGETGWLKKIRVWEYFAQGGAMVLKIQEIIGMNHKKNSIQNSNLSDSYHSNYNSIYYYCLPIIWGL